MSGKTLSTAIFLLAAIPMFAQTINYQSVARNAQGAPLANTPIAVRLSIKNAQTGGSTFYTETKTATTNGFGLYTISINDGSGNLTGSFGNINWSKPTYIQTEIDPANGSAFTDMGTSLMQSVPSAIVADNLRGVKDPQEGDLLVFRNNLWQKKPGNRFFQATGAGSFLGVGPDEIKILSQPIVVQIEHFNAKLIVSATKEFGSNATGGGFGLKLGLGYRRTDIPNQPLIVLTPINISTSTLRVSLGTRIPMTITGVFAPDLVPGTYEVGLVGYALSETTRDSWNSNGLSYGYVELEY